MNSTLFCLFLTSNISLRHCLLTLNCKQNNLPSLSILHIAKNLFVNLLVALTKQNERKIYKAHAGKVKSLTAINATKYFSNLAGSSKFSFYCQNHAAFCGYNVIIVNFFYNFKME